MRYAQQSDVGEYAELARQRFPAGSDDVGQVLMSEAQPDMQRSVGLRYAVFRREPAEGVDQTARDAFPGKLRQFALETG